MNVYVRVVPCVVKEKKRHGMERARKEKRDYCTWCTSLQ